MTITFPELAEVTGKLADRRKALADLFAEAKNDKGELDHNKVKGFASGSELAEHVRAVNAEIDDLAIKREELVDVAKAAKLASESDSLDPELTAWLAGESGAPAVGGRKQTKTFGDLFVESKAGSDLKDREVELDFEAKTLFATSAGWAPDSVRSPRVVFDEQRPVQVVDFIPQRTTDQTSIVYMEETTFTNNAAEVAEGGTKPEGALVLTERTSPVRKIAVWIPVTDEQLEDVVGIGQYLENRLTFMVRQRLDLQIISGDGTAPNLSGILDVSGIQTQAKGADPTPDAIFKAITKVNVTGQSMANLIIMHPNDWQDVRLLRTADGIYIWGSPSDAGPERMWGLPVAVVQAATENTAIVLDTQFTELAWKKGMSVKVSDSHSDYFIKNQQAVRAECRAAFTLFRPAAACSVTGI